MKIIKLSPFYTVDRGTHQEHYLTLFDLLLSYEGQTKESLSILN